jgi:selenide, water dikinase
MALASAVSLQTDAKSIPTLSGAIECIRAGFIPGGLKSNEEFAMGCVDFAAGVPEETRKLLFDPQTAGGLLLAVSAERADEIVAALREKNVPAVHIGEVIAKTKPLIAVM